jgi:hypothetical protein
VREPYAVRKLDITSEFFYLVDLRIEGAVLISPESVVKRSRNYLGLKQEARELNAALDNSV